MSHQCPGIKANGEQCEARVSSDMLACRPHWYQLPKEIRDRVWATWRSGDDAGHDQAVMDAVSWYRDRAAERAASGSAAES